MTDPLILTGLLTTHLATPPPFTDLARFVIHDPTDPQPAHETQIVVYLGEVPAGPLPDRYAACYPDGGRGIRERLVAAPTGLAWGADFVSVGRTRNQCLWVHQRIRERLAGARLDSRLSQSPLNEQETGDRPRIDRTVPDDVRHVLNSRYTLTLTRSQS